MEIDKKVNFIEILTLVCLIVGGVFSYLLVSKQNVKESEAATKLSAVQTKLVKLELLTKGIQGQLSVDKIKLETALDATVLAASLEPKLQTKGVNTTISDNGKALKLLFAFKNIGDHSFEITRTDISLYRSEGDRLSQANELIEGTHYSVFPPTRPSATMAGQDGQSGWVFNRLRGKWPDDLFMQFSVSLRVDQLILKVATPTLAQYLSEEELEGLTNRSIDFNADYRRK